MNKRTFADSRVVITGAAGGLGQAFARRFGQAGARVALLDLDATQTQAVADTLAREGVETLVHACDVTDPDSCAAALAHVEATWGGIDVLFNNAGITHSSVFAETDLTVLRKVIEVNLFGAIHCTRAAIQSLIRNQGLIVVISSMAGQGPLLGRTGYAASKHALHGLFDSLRAEVAERGVEVLLVCPTFVATGIGAAALGADGRPAGRTQATVGKVAQPPEIAEAVFRAAERRQRLLVPSAVGRLSRWINFLWPALYERLMVRSVRAELKP